MAGRAPTTDQLPLDFEGPFAERMAEVRAALRSIERSVTGLGPTRWKHVQEVLLAVHCHAGGELGRWVAKHPDELRADTKTSLRETLSRPLSRDQWYRARTEAVALGLLDRDYDNREEERLPDRLRVRIEGVRELVARSRKLAPTAQSQQPPAGPSPLSKVERCDQGATRVRLGCDLGATLIRNPVILETSNQNPSTTTRSAHQRAEQPDAANPNEWAAVVVEVEGAGINQAVAAVAAARSLGASPAELLAVLAYWRVHRDGFEFAEHALYRRLRRTASGDDPRTGWPPFRRGYRVASDEAAERERKSASAEAWSQRQRELAEADERKRQALAARRRTAREGVA